MRGGAGRASGRVRAPCSPLVQITPASCLCLQLLFSQPRELQLASEGSVPVHSTSSNMIGPDPGGTARTQQGHSASGGRAREQGCPPGPHTVLSGSPPSSTVPQCAPSPHGLSASKVGWLFPCGCGLIIATSDHKLAFALIMLVSFIPPNLYHNLCT